MTRPTLFDVEMREAELRNPTARSYRQAGDAAFESELEAMVQSRATQGTQPMNSFTPTPEQFGGLIPPQVVAGPQGLMSNASFPQAGGDQFTPSPDQFASLGFPQVGQELVQNPQDNFTPKPEEFDALGFETIGDSQEELMQNTAETMSNLKTGKDVTPIDAAKAAEVIKQDTVDKGGDPDLFKEAPEGVDKSVWEGFNDQFDLTTIGLTLLATNGNGKNLAANMGLALQAGLESKKNELSSVASARLKTEDRALDRQSKLASIDLDKAKTQDAIADSKATLAAITSGKVKPVNATQIAVEQSYLSGLTEGAKASEVPKDMAEFSATNRQILINNGITDKNTQDQMIYEALESEGFLDEKFFGGYALTTTADRLGL